LTAQSYLAMPHHSGDHQYLLQYPTSGASGPHLGPSSHLHPGTAYPVCSLKIPGYNVLHMPSAYLSGDLGGGGARSRHNGDPSVNRSLGVAAHQLMQYVENEPQIYRVPGQFISRHRYEMLNRTASAMMMQQSGMWYCWRVYMSECSENTLWIIDPCTIQKYV